MVACVFAGMTEVTDPARIEGCRQRVLNLLFVDGV
jgi:hypothetical protein